MRAVHRWMVTTEMENAAFEAYLDEMHTFKQFELSSSDITRIRKACRRIVAAALAVQPTTGGADE